MIEIFPSTMESVVFSSLPLICLVRLVNVEGKLSLAGFVPEAMN
jgi:hypothetical protein